MVCWCACRVMDGVREACVKGGVEACYSSVACSCSLLHSLHLLSQGQGLQPDQVTRHAPLLATPTAM